MKQPSVLLEQWNCFSWITLSPGWVKCNIDTSLQPYIWHHRIGMRYKRQQMCRPQCHLWFCLDMSRHRTYGSTCLLEWSLLGTRSGYNAVMFKLDNKTLVEFVIRDVIPRTEAGKIMANILHILKSFNRVLFQKFGRSCNVLMKLQT